MKQILTVLVVLLAVALVVDAARPQEDEGTAKKQRKGRRKGKGNKQAATFTMQDLEIPCPNEHKLCVKEAGKGPENKEKRLECNKVNRKCRKQAKNCLRRNKSNKDAAQTCVRNKNVEQ